MDAAERRTALGTVGLVGVLVLLLALLLVLVVGLVRAQADLGAPQGVRGPVADLDEGGWGYGWCRCAPTGDIRP